MWRSKLVTSAEEVTRKLRNMDRVHEQSEVLEIIKIFSQKMVDIGYDSQSRKEVLKSGVRKHPRDLARAIREGTSIYRTRGEMNKKKEWLSLLNKPLFRRMRGGALLKLEKEGTERTVARDKMRSKPKEEKLDVKRSEDNQTRKVKLIECVVYIPTANFSYHINTSGGHLYFPISK